jgi:hypothetical protein
LNSRRADLNRWRERALQSERKLDTEHAQRISEFELFDHMSDNAEYRALYLNHRL